MTRSVRCVFALALATLLAALAVAGGCARRAEGPRASGAARPEAVGTPAAGEVIAIATQSPLSGPLQPLGREIVQGARLAVEDGRERFQRLGFQLELIPYDDADPGQGIANAELILADPRVLGVVGHLNSETAVPASEKYNQDGLVLVSPVNTAVELTDRGLPTVNRLVARDDAQGRAAAAFAAGKLDARRVFVVHDRTMYGQGLADAFKAAVEELGARVEAYRGIARGQRDFKRVVEELAGKRSELLYFAGMPGDGGRLLRQVRAGGFKGAFLGGDGLGTREFARAAGDAAAGVYFTSVLAPPRTSDAGRRWASRYHARFGAEPEIWAAAAYDAAGVLLQGIESALRDDGGRRPARSLVSRAVRLTREFQGVTGPVGFDGRGDNRFASPESIRVYVFRRRGVR